MGIEPDFYDAELHRHNEHLRAAANVRPHDRSGTCSIQVTALAGLR